MSSPWPQAILNALPDVQNLAVKQIGLGVEPRFGRVFHHAKIPDSVRQRLIETTALSRFLGAGVAGGVSYVIQRDANP